MSPDQPSAPSPRSPLPDLVLPELPRWRRILADGPVAIGAEVERADAAGLQLLAAALCRSPGRARIVMDEGSAVAALWRRLGLDDPADAEPVVEDGCVVALRAAGGPA